MTAPKTVAFIGVGAIGLPMALRIAGAGYRVLAVEAAPQRQAVARAAGLTVIEMPGVAEADIVIAMVATAEQLDSALVGERGAFGYLSGSSTAVIMSTVGPAAAEKVAAAAAERGIAVLDVPVTGGVRGAQDATLTLLAAGDPATLARAEPVLSAMGALRLCGNKIGDGQAFKLVNQLLCSVHLAAAAEALAFADRLGLNPGVVLDAVTSGAGGSWMLADRGPRILADMRGDDVDVTATVDIFVKDSTLVAEAACDIGFTAPLLSAARDMLVTAAELGHGAGDDSQVGRAYRR